MSMELVKSGSGFSQAEIEALINYDYIVGASGLGYIPVSQNDLDQTILGLNAFQAQLDAKVSKIGGTLGQPIWQWDDQAIATSNAWITPENQGGQVALRFYGVRVILDPGYAVLFTKARAEFSNGIFWDMGGRSVEFSTVDLFSVKTAVTNTEIVSMGTGRHTVFRPYSSSHSVIVRGQSSQTVPILDVQRADGSPVIRINDIPRPTYNPSDTTAQLGQKLQDLGILG